MSRKPDHNGETLTFRKLTKFRSIDWPEIRRGGDGEEENMCSTFIPFLPRLHRGVVICLCLLFAYHGKSNRVKKTLYCGGEERKRERGRERDRESVGSEVKVKGLGKLNPVPTLMCMVNI